MKCAIRILLQLFLIFRTTAKPCLNTTQLLNLASPPATKIVIFHYWRMSQPELIKTLTEYPRLRDFHSRHTFEYSRAKTLGPIVNLAVLVTSVINASLVAPAKSISICGEDERSMPTIYPYRFAYRIKKTKPLRLIQENDIRFNFVYCAQPTLAQYANWFKMLTSTADIFVWSCVIGAIILVGYTVPLILNTEQGHLHRRLGQIILAALAALLTSGSGAQPRFAQHSVLFTLWMYICMIFVIYYGGSLTSEIVSPTPEHRITTMDELFENDYRLAYQNGTYRRRMLSYLVSRMLKGWKQKKGAKLTAAQRAIKKLEALNQTVVTVSSLHQYHQMITGDGKYAMITDWQGCISEVNQITDYLEQKGLGERIKCYIGQKLAFHSSKYYLITPSYLQDSERMMTYFQTLVQMGFYQVWIREYEGLSSAKRVQDRGRVKGPTNMIEDKEEFQELQLQGKLHNVFVLWGICLGGCVLTFLKELTHFSITKYVKTCRRRVQRKVNKRKKLKARNIDKVPRFAHVAPIFLP